jgi:D-alanyl-D-alanine-carboxypeptidase/D-alanyl-D-alanine-endopeptidase
MGKVTTALHMLGALRAMPVTNALRVLVTVALETPALLVMLGALAPAHAHPAASMPPDAAFEATDRLFENYSLDAHVPGLVYGIVADGRLVHVRAFGVQDLETRRPITADSLFRIASMTKAFTALTVLKLRDDGRLRLDALAEDYIPEMRGWKYPTDDSRRVRVRDLLNHVAGFVTDDPWGDRQTSLPEEEFTQLLRSGVPLTRAPGSAYEYSNLGFALLGRIITNVSRQPYAETIGRTLLPPLGMESSGFIADAAPRERRALGYRWEDNTWRLEPTLAPGAFGAMGGLQTSANDYAKWVAFLLSAWPPRDGPDSGPVRRATVRELAEGSDFLSLRTRPGRGGADACREPAAYGMGMQVAADCDLGLTLSHSGGYPGYGSHVLLLVDHGVGIFAFANRTYGIPVAPAWDAAVVLHSAGVLPRRSAPVSAELAAAYRVAAGIYAAGTVTASRGALAMNFLLDRDATHWASYLAGLKAQVGDCDTAAPLSATGLLSGDFTWPCTHGRLQGSLLLAPTQPPGIQQLDLAVIAP